MNFERHYEELIDVYNDLKDANLEFLTKNNDAEGFEQLNELRTTLFENIDIIKESLIRDLDSANVDFSYNNLEMMEILRELPKHYPELAAYKEKLSETLKQLMITEKNTTDAATNIYNDLKSQIQSAKKGKQVLNAYKPVTGYSGSYFIDSKK